MKIGNERISELPIKFFNKDGEALGGMIWVYREEREKDEDYKVYSKDWMITLENEQDYESFFTLAVEVSKQMHKEGVIDYEVQISKRS